MQGVPLGEETNSLSSNSQVILVSQGPERLVEQLLSDRLETKREVVTGSGGIVDKNGQCIIKNICITLQKSLYISFHRFSFN